MSETTPVDGALLLENLSDACLAIATDGSVVWTNARAVVLLGQTGGRLVGRKVWDLFPALPATPEALHPWLARQGHTWQAEQHEARPRLQVHAVASGQNLLLFIHPSTEAKADVEPQPAALLGPEIADALPVLIAFVDAEQRYQFNNRTYELWFGVSRDQLRGRHLRDALGAEVYRSIRPAVEAALAGQDVRMDMVLPLPGAGTRALDVRYIPHRNRQGQVDGFHALIQDIGHERASREALEASEQRLRRALEHCPIPALIHAETGEILHLSRSWSEATGFSHQELPSLQAWCQRAHVDDEEPSKAAALYTCSAAPVTARQTSIRTRSGTRRLWSITSAPLGALADGRQATISMAVDVTEQKEAEERLRAQEQRQSFLLTLGDQLRAAVEPADIVRIAAAALGRQLRVARAGYAQLDVDKGTVQVDSDWTDGRVPSLASHSRPVGHFGPSLLQPLQAGATLRINDVEAQDALQAQRDIFREMETRALLLIPYRKADRLSGVLHLHEPGPRTWGDDEVALAEAVAERTWSALEAVHALAALKESETRSRLAQEAAQWGVFDYDFRADLAYWSPELRLLYGVAPHTSIKGVDDWAQRLHPDDRAQALQLLTEAKLTGEYCHDFRILRENGGIRWLFARARVLRDAAGAPQRMVGVNVDITDRKLAEEALRISNERFERAQAGALAGTWDWDVPSGELIWSNGIYALLGLAVEGAVPTVDFWMTFVLPEDRSMLQRQLTVLLERGGSFSLEFRIRRTDGAVRWLASLGQVVLGSDGTHSRLAGVNIDITARKEAERAVRQSEELLRLAQRTAGAGVWQYDPTSGHAWWSEDCYRLYGQDPKTFQPSFANWANSVLDEDRPNALAMVQRAMTGQRPLNFEFRIRHPQKGIRWLWEVGELQAPSAERPAYLVGIALDITERKEAERALRQSELRFSTAFQASPDALVITRAQDGTVHEVNEAWCQLFGWKRHEVVGRTSVELNIFTNEAARRHVIDRFRTTGRLKDYEMEVQTRSGERRTIMFSLAHLELDGEPMILGQVRDVTDQKRVLAELAAARDAALAASRAKDSFMAMLSHELRTPLNPALLESTDAADDPALPDPIRKRFRHIADHIRLEARLIDDLLDLNRITMGKALFDIRPIDLHEVVNEAIATISDELSAKNLRLTLDCAASRTMVQGDAVRLRQVLWNVIKNAIKFTPARGEIVVTSRNCDQDERIEVTVRDTGVGLHQHDLVRIFEPFVQGRSLTPMGVETGGLGLGLSIARSIIERLGGSIRAESPGPGGGTSIILVLATATPAAAPASVKPRVTVALNGESLRGKRVLLVEDHVPTRRTLASLLARRGLTVATAASKAEAVRSAEAFDLLISDLGLPDGDGCQLLAELRERRPVPAAIALSGYGMDNDLARSRAAGFSQHLIKPVSVEALEHAIRHALGMTPLSTNGSPTTRPFPTGAADTTKSATAKDSG